MSTEQPRSRKTAAAKANEIDTSANANGTVETVLEHEAPEAPKVFENASRVFFRAGQGFLALAVSVYAARIAVEKFQAAWEVTSNQQ